MYDALQDDRYFYTVIPFLGFDLQVTMQPNSGVDLNHAFLLQCLVQNLLDLQQHRIIHRDYSPENVIVCHYYGELRFLLIDLSMAIRCTTQDGNTLRIAPPDIVCWRRPFMSPEVVRREALDFGVDVWALG